MNQNERIIGLASDFAEEVVVDMAEQDQNLKREDVWYIGDDGDEHFTEEFQDIFNKWYDYFKNEITRRLIYVSTI